MSTTRERLLRMATQDRQQESKWAGEALQSARDGDVGGAKVSLEAAAFFRREALRAETEAEAEAESS